MMGVFGLGAIRGALAFLLLSGSLQPWDGVVRAYSSHAHGLIFLQAAVHDAVGEGSGRLRKGSYSTAKPSE
ncbi:hypothetical protein BDW66DRAFT_141807 [Aspergillus desertorum]